MLDWLDDGLDELAASAHRGAPFRALITVGVAATATRILPLDTCLGWLTAILLADGWNWWATRKQARQEKVEAADRLQHLGAFFLVCSIWMLLGLLLWNTGRMDAAVGAITIWLSVIFYAQSNGYQSRIGLVVGGVLPTIGMLVAVAVTPAKAGFDMWLMLSMLALGIIFAADGAISMFKVRQRHELARAQLMDSEARYRLLATNLGDVVALMTLDGKRIYLSPSIERGLGYKVEDLIQTPSFSFLHPEDAKWLPAQMAGLVHGSGEMVCQYRVIHRDGSIHWVETDFRLIQSDDPSADRQVLSMSRVIDARKALEDELVVARQTAERAAAAKSDFLANMTHELRTPLNAILGFSGILRQSDRIQGEDAHHVALINDASETLLSLVNSVLDFSRLEAGAVQLEVRPLDPRSAVTDMVRMVEAQASDRGIVVVSEFHGEAVPLVGDLGRLRQVVLNFLSNAIKFGAGGQVVARTLLTPVGESRCSLRVEVEDNGIGIAPEKLDHLFERFTQADVSVSRQYGGTGLGLAICKHTIELMGGTIGASSREGLGSTFWFEVTFPVASQWPQTVEVGASETPERPLRLLLVEDVAVNRELVQTLLRDFEVEVVTAENGQEAVAAMTGSVFDLVLMDVQMPIMDGLTATRAIRALDNEAARTTPIIAMTANVLPEQVSRCLDAGMDDHIGKPISPARLLETLAHWSQDPEEARAARALAPH